VRVGFLDLVGDGIDSYSALLMLRRFALRRTESLRFSIMAGPPSPEGLRNDTGRADSLPGPGGPHRAR